MSTVILAVLIVAALRVAALLLFIASNNRLAALDARCNTALADIDAQLKQRADLIPGLIECVRGFAAREVEILGDVAEARKAAVAMAGDARLDVEAALGRKVGEYRARLGQQPGVLMARLAHCRARRPYDLGVDRVALDDAVAFRFAPPTGAGN